MANFSRFSAGACHAPQTTATVSAPDAIASRIVRRIHASRYGSSGSRGPSASPRSSPIASATAAKMATPSSCCRPSTTCSHHRSPSSKPAASASRCSGSGSTTRGTTTGAGGASSSDSPTSGVGRLASISAFSLSIRSAATAMRTDCGKSMNRTGVLCVTAHRIACHSGENSANG